MTKRIFVPALGFLWLIAATGLNAAPADPPLPPGGAAILTWTPEQQAWGYRNMEKLAPVETALAYFRKLVDELDDPL